MKKYMKNYNKKLNILLCFCLAFLTSGLFADDKILTLGGKDGWPQFAYNDGVTFTKGRFGFNAVTLATNFRKVNDNTDLLLDFESSSMKDVSCNYDIVKNELVRLDECVMGHNSALSRGRGKGLTLKGKPGTIFGTEGNPGSFAIEFWIKPSVAENGEILFSWNSSRTVNEYVMYQMISASFANSRIEWNFKNIFDGYRQNNGEVVLTSYSTIIPEKWSHHVLVFNEETGLLEYKIDGKTEDLKYLTDSGHERGSIFQPVLGLPNDIIICQSYTGCIDDFRILHSLSSDVKTGYGYNSESISSLTSEKYDSYKVTGAKFITNPINTVPGALIKKIETVQNVPSQTELRYFIRTGDNFFGWTENEPEWIPVNPGVEMKNVSGRYFQLACELYPDGDGKVSPSITEIKVTYFEPSLPLAPAKIKAEAGDESVNLTWSYSLDDTTEGYYVYYGTRPGEYLGLECNEGSSPIKVGNVNSVKLTGLKNGAIYYFVVAAYSKFDNKIIGNFSDEVYARPRSSK